MSNNDPANPGPQIQVDSDWKAQAQAEKAKLAAKEQARKAPAEPAAQDTPRGASAAAQGERFPPADFAGLMNIFVSQSVMALGGMAHPQTGQPNVDLDLASHFLGLLGVLEDKTRGNLTEQEAKELATTLYELRSTYIQISNASRSPATGGQGAGM
ncbi:MAG: DUF1844 domain-containing protein [Phycisphaerales bacterium JB063]